jgi:charged multivesicular body protein 3
MSVSKAQLGSIDSQLQQQLCKCNMGCVRESIVLMLLYLAMAKVTGTLQKSTEIMKLSNQLVKLPQFNQTMREMSMEMTKVSYIWFLILSRFPETFIVTGWYHGRDDGRCSGSGR